MSLDKAFDDADAVLIINDHPNYAKLDLGAHPPDAAPAGVRLRLVARPRRGGGASTAGVRYAGLGYLA